MLAFFPKFCQLSSLHWKRTSFPDLPEKSEFFKEDAGNRIQPPGTAHTQLRLSTHVGRPVPLGGKRRHIPDIFHGKRAEIIKKRED